MRMCRQAHLAEAVHWDVSASMQDACETLCSCCQRLHAMRIGAELIQLSKSCHQGHQSLHLEQMLSETIRCPPVTLWLECNGIRTLCMSDWSTQSMTWVQHTHLQICRRHYFKGCLRQAPKEGMLHQCRLP